MSKKHFENLDGLRFLAAISVIFAHCTVFIPFSANNPVSTVLSKMFLYNGDLGVNFFFVLSGFLITYIILEEKQTGNFSIKSFYIRRVLRIWAVYFIVVFASVILSYAIEYKES